jgi:hypothetical protein
MEMICTTLVLDPKKSPSKQSRATQSESRDRGLVIITTRTAGNDTAKAFGTPAPHRELRQTPHVLIVSCRELVRTPQLLVT